MHGLGHARVRPEPINGELDDIGSSLALPPWRSSSPLFAARPKVLRPASHMLVQVSGYAAQGPVTALRDRAQCRAQCSEEHSLVLFLRAAASGEYSVCGTAARTMRHGLETARPASEHAHHGKVGEIVHREPPSQAIA